MEENAANFVCVVHHVFLILVLSCQATVHHNRERLEVAIGAEEQIEVCACHIVPYKLVEGQIDKLAALEDEQSFVLAPAVNRAVVVDEASDHELNHNHYLRGDPDFLDKLARTELILRILVLSHCFVVNHLKLGDLSLKVLIQVRHVSSCFIFLLFDEYDFFNFLIN